MGIEKLSLPFLSACRRLLTRNMESRFNPKCMYHHSSLLTNLGVQPNVILSNNNTEQVARLPNRHQWDIRRRNTIQKSICRSYAIKRTSDDSASKNDIDTSGRYSGLDPSKLKLGFEKIKELEDADERVKKIFSLEFADDSEILAYRRAKLTEKVQTDPTDESLAVKIARTTLTIRTAAKQYASNKKDARNKRILLGSIGRRRRMLKHLRKTDYERFEKLLVELGITYTLPPPVNAFRRHTRKYLEKLTVVRAARDQRLEAMNEYLARQRDEKMREIAELKKELGVEFTEEEMKYLEDKSAEEK